MLFGTVLALATLLAWAIGPRSAGWPTHARRGLAVAMAFAGIAHLAGPDPFIQHLPAWMPGREALVFLTGLAEIALGAALVVLPTRRAAIGRLLAVFLLAIWPANIYVAVAGVDVEGQPDGPYPWIRLPFQILFIACALWSTRSPTDDPRDVAPAADVAAAS